MGLSLLIRLLGPSALPGRAAAFRRFFRSGGLFADALHVARFANKARQPREAAAFHPDLGENLVDDRCLHTVTQSGIDHFVGGTAPTAPAVEAIQLHDTYAFDFLHRLDALAYDPLDTLEQPTAVDRCARGIRKDIFCLVGESLCFRLDPGPDLFGGRRDPHFLSLLFGDEHLDGPTTACCLAFAHSLHPLLRLDCLCTSRLGLRLRRRLFERFPMDLDRALHAGGLNCRLAGDLKLAHFAFADDSRLVEAAFRGDARPLDLFASRNLGFLQRLHPRDLELLDGAPPFEPRDVDRLFAHHVRAFHLLIGDDVGFLDPAVRIRALGELGRNFDRTALLGDLDDLAPIHIEDLPGLRRRDALAFQSEFCDDTRGFDRFTALDLRVLNRSFALDVARFGFLFGGNALDRDLLLLLDASRLHGLARRDFQFFDRAGPGYVECPDALLLLDARTGCDFARRDFGFLKRPRPLNFEGSRRKLGGDPLGGERLLARDARGFRGLGRRDLLLLDRAIARDLAASDFLFKRDALVGNDPLLRDARALGHLARGNLRLLQITHSLDIEPSILLLLSDARIGYRQFLRDACLFGLFTRRNLGLFNVARAFDLATLIVLLARDTRFGNNPLLCDTRAFDALARCDFRLVDLAAPFDLALANLAQRAFARQLGALNRAPHFDVAFLIEASRLAFPINLQCLLLGLKVTTAY